MNKEEITKHLKEVHKKQETETAESGYFSESTCQGTGHNHLNVHLD